MRRVVVTGAGGQLGVELVRRAPVGVEVIGLDRTALDIGDGVAVHRAMRDTRPSAIINAGAYTAVDRAESEPDAAHRANAEGPRHLAAAAAATGARLLHVSTDFVFDGGKSSPYLPEDDTAPLGVYGASKLAGEQAVRDTAGVDALIVRTGWVYSAHGQNFVKTMLRLMRERPEVRVVADQIGTPTSTATLADTLWTLLDRDAPSGTYHCSDAGVASWYDFAYAIRELAQASSGEQLAPVRPIATADYPTPARRPAYSVLDKTTTWAITGMAPHWREPLRAVIDELVR
ncbi:dTDP-4-dehydrorhamnose reductase [Sinimarinibacterium thermocellulolyticum]|uniref:dTDP-4-dehydrorhamnose reductase n=1 Tax=Sinimarinibacterium thermocellulolyticum TaxID=3170016 RepID=A0ABV2ACD6_9GAMM